MPNTKNEAKEFLKFLKHSECSVVEQLHKQSAHISVLALLLNSESHRSALIKVLNKTYVFDDISVNKLDRLVNNISADNFISFSDEKIPLGGMGSTKALHITTRSKGYTLPGVLIDNGSALNILPLSTLNRLPVDSSHMKACQNIVRAFDDTERKVMGRIEIPLLIRPNTYEVDFLVMDIKPSYNCLLGRLWIHSAGAVPSSLHQKLKLVAEGRLITINAKEDIIASVSSDVPYIENDTEEIERSFRSLEFVNATFIIEGSRIPVPRISEATRMGLRLTVGKGALPGRDLEKYLHGRVEVQGLVDKRDRFGLGHRPDTQWRKEELERKRKRRRVRLNGAEVKWGLMTFPHISNTFVSGGIIHSGSENMNRETVEEMIRALSINAVSEESPKEGNLAGINLAGIRPYEPGSVLDNWTAEEIPVDFTDDGDCSVSPDLLRMVEREEKLIIPHKETIESVILKKGKEVKIGTLITKGTRQDLVRLLLEFKDVFAWSYQDMPGLSADVAVHRIPIKEECKPIQQKLRMMRPDVTVANVVPVPKKDGKVQMCVDYIDLNKASPKDNFPLPHIDALVDNTAGYSLFSFMDGFSGYNQIKMHLENMEKTTFISMWGTFCYKVMPFGLKNAGAIYQRAMVTLFHDMIHKEIEVYVDDMIAKSRTEKEHIQVLKKLFLRLRKFQLKLNPTKCTFRARSGKLLGFVVSERGIEVDPDKVRAVLELPSPRTQKEKHNPSIRDNECQKAFDKIKQYLSNTSVLMPPSPNRPLILYLTYMLYHTTWLISKLDPLKYMMESTALNGRMTRWQILLSEFDIVYANQKAVKGSAIADFLANRALDDYEPLNFDFPNEDLMFVATTEEDTLEGCPWKLNFDGVSNAVGNGVGAVLISPNGDHFPFTCKLDFDCTNNMAEYEACIMGIRAAIDRKVKMLEVYGDSALVIYQLKGEWETRDPKLISYRKLVLELIEEFDDITFFFLPRDENQMVDALATVASMIRVN
ncbi:RNA-directed DNA polymerase (Reverse transcriptase), Ribonuclease H-like protein [Gossypium australe]|uniref:RNA-directed DNA polymerase (Reverse transcriptase), Ribonuclease H-like protein n=1 Tax=Gossypium australe TaxID=47621 RepID=A0A5B6VK70_9ROSI|nr:RNA-directed DNA polymerase (Reverse transcriptase), Ribonuclease H-like protein [Gossypium australe]